MSFKRSIFPRKILEGEELDSALRTIGFNLSQTFKIKNPNIEDLLISASIEAVNKNNGRIAGLLVDWITTHYSRINVDRLTSIVTSIDEKEFKWVKVFWCANAQRLKDIRFKRLANLYSKKRRFDYIDRNAESKEYVATEYLLKRNGEDERFKDTCIRIPNKIFQHRSDQIFSAEQIIRQHSDFKHRVIFGSSYRADMWSALEIDPHLSPSKLASKTYGSYSTAHQVKNDFLITGVSFSRKRA